MHDVHQFLKALAMVLCVAAVTTVLFQRLRQPVVLGYIIAGLIIGPYVPIPLVADQAIVRTLSELGVILLMFSLGLEFSLRRLIQVGPSAGITAVIQCGLMIWLGFVVGKAFGWTNLESVYTGAMIAISSTTIIAKAFDEQNIRGRLREVVVGILIVEDLIAILLIATLTAVSTGAGLSAGALAATVGKLVAFLVGLIVIGLFVIPGVVRSIVRLKRPETTVIASIGICFAVALLALEFGYSVALGAFLAGSLIAESGEEKTIEHLVQPVKDVFAAVFFVSVGMLIDPALVLRHWTAIVVLTVVVVLGKVIGVTLGAFLSGHSTRTSVQAGMSLAQIGEFSFIIAGLGLSMGATREFLYPVAVTVSAVTTLTTPWLIRAAGPVASYIDRKLPRALQTFVALYGSWIENLRSPSRRTAPGKELRRLIRLLAVDATLLAILIIGTALSLPAAVRFIREKTGLDHAVARVLVLGGAGAMAIPFSVGIIRVARRLGVSLAERALPASANGKVDLAAAPRRVLVVTLQLASVLIVGIPLLAITQPFLPGFQGAIVLGIILLALGVGFWRSATNLQGHVRAGAQAIIEALAAQSRGKASGAEDDLEDVHELLPGIGEPVPVRLHSSSPAIGKSLSDLNLRGVTGATVLAIRRGGAGVLVPTAQEILQAGDVLALAGTLESIEAARAVLGVHARAEA
jgi:monovalent cation:H+ antiporter-2, CPA2 family